MRTSVRPRIQRQLAAERRQATTSGLLHLAGQILWAGTIMLALYIIILSWAVILTSAGVTL